MFVEIWAMAMTNMARISSGRNVPSEPRNEHHGVPDRLAEDHDGRRRHRDADEGEGRHRQREAEGLPEDLRALGFRVAGEVGDVEGERDPVPHVRREAWPEERPERALSCCSLAEVVNTLAMPPPAEKPQTSEREAADEEKRRGKRLEDLNPLDAEQNDHDLYHPEHEEGYKGVPGNVGPPAPDGGRQRVEGEPRRARSVCRTSRRPPAPWP